MSAPAAHIGPLTDEDGADGHSHPRQPPEPVEAILEPLEAMHGAYATETGDVVTLCGYIGPAASGPPVARWEPVTHPTRRGPGWEPPDFVDCPACRAGSGSG